MADTLSRRYVLLFSLDAKILGFEFIKYLYEIDENFDNVFKACEREAFDKFYKHDGFLFRENKLCVPRSSVRELLVKEAHRGGFMRHFGVHKTLDVLLVPFFLPHMRQDIECFYQICIVCKKAK